MTEQNKLNIAGKVAEAFIQSKITLIIIIGSILFGLAAIHYTPRTYNPEIVVPAVNISVSRPGSSGQEMLNQVIRPLEAIMASIPGIDHTFGMAVDDKGIVTVHFEVGENEEDSLVKIYNKLNSNMDRMPSGTLTPLVQSVSLYDVALVTITLSSPTVDAMDLHRQANLLIEYLRSVPFTGKSWVSGSSPASVKVWLDPDKLNQYYIPLQKVKQALVINNVGYDSGKLESHDHVTNLRVNAELLNPADVGNIMIGVFDGHPVFLKDVARIERAPEDDNIASYFAYGKANEFEKTPGQLNHAATIAIARQKGSNGVEVARHVLSRLDTYKKEKLPKDIDVTVTRDYGHDADVAVNRLISHLGIAVFAVVIILLIFLGWREAAIVSISIPLILSIVLGIGWLFGETMSRVTVFSLILTLGLLVDDSIVVIENIHRHLIEHPIKNFVKLIVAAANEIGVPTIVATFTVILAVLPMAFVTGMMGPFIKPIPFNAPIAMFASLIIAYTVVPYLACRWLKPREDDTTSKDKQYHVDPSYLRRNYKRSITFLIRYPKKRHIFYGIVLCTFILVLLQPIWQFIRPSGTNGPLSPLAVGLKILPDDNVNTFLVEVDNHAGSALSETTRIAKEIGAVLDQNNYVTDYQIFLGEAAPPDFASMVKGDLAAHGSEFAQIRVNLKDKHERSIQSHKIVMDFYASLDAVRKAYPQADIKLFETPPGPPVASQMQAGLYGPNYPLLRRLAINITDNIYPTVYGMINSDNSVTGDSPEYRILVDQQKAISTGFVPSTLADDVHAYFAGVAVGHVHNAQARESEDIILRLPIESRQNLDDVNKLLLMNNLSETVPMIDVAEVKEVIKNKPIFTRDQHPLVYLTGEMLFSSPVYGVITIKRLLNHAKLSDGHELTVNNLGLTDAQPDDLNQTELFWLGEMRLTLDLFRDLGSVLLVALLMIYFLLTAIYRSFTLPCIIMGAIPLTIIGIFPGHWIMQQPFTATSMIGLIVLAGIVVRNSLLLIDFIIEGQKSGVPVEEAVIEAGTVRILPILLTALAIILGSSVMVTDPVFGGLAISLIFGTFASTVLTLYLIPLIYLSLWKRTGSLVD